MTETAPLQAPARQTAFRRAATLLRWGLSLALLAVVAYQLATRWEVLRAQVFVFAPGMAAAALGVLALYFVIGAELWRRLLAAQGAEITWRSAFYTVYYANVAKYLPGSVWNMVGRVVLCQRLGVKTFAASTALLMDVVCQVVAGVLIGLLTLPVVAGATDLAKPTVVLPVTALALLVLAGLHPRVLNGVFGLAERLLASMGASRQFPRVPYGYGFVLAMVAGYTLNWALLGCGFALLGQAFLPTALGLENGLLLAGAFAIAWNIGLFALFAPAGLGVREAAIALLLGAAFPTGWPALIALASRVWIILGEALAFVAAWAFAPKQAS